MSLRNRFVFQAADASFDLPPLSKCTPQTKKQLKQQIYYIFIKVNTLLSHHVIKLSLNKAELIGGEKRSILYLISRLIV